MVFLVRNHLFLERKMVFGGLLLGKPSFSREKDGFEPKNHLFLEKTKKNQKNQKETIFSKTMGLGPPKDGFFVFFLFFWFSREKDGFLVRNHLFLEKKMVLPGEDLQKPSFSREKDGFEPENHLFLEKTKKSQKNQKNHLFQNYGAGASKRCFFWFFWFFWFSREKMVFWFKTIFLSRKRWFLEVFSWENHLFLEKKMVFGGLLLAKPSFSREKDGFPKRRPPKTIFFSRKRWFRTKKTIFFSRKPKKPSFGGPSPIVLEKMVFLVFFCFFGFFVFCFFVSFLFCCCSLDLARTRMPPAVGPFGGGGGG